jgi:hypothetical protein
VLTGDARGPCPYRSTDEVVRVAFDARAEACTLWLGDQRLAPQRAPWSSIARGGTAVAVLTIAAGLLFLLLGICAGQARAMGADGPDRELGDPASYGQ